MWQFHKRKLHTRLSTLVTLPAPGDESRLLYDRKEAARQLSISIRALDYLIAGKKLSTRRIGKKVLIPRGELVRFSRADHPESVQEAA